LKTNKNRRLFSPEIFSAGFVNPPAFTGEQAAHLHRPTYVAEKGISSEIPQKLPDAFQDAVRPGCGQ
jgi:hypothetical protein